MRSSAPEGQHAPRAKQAPPSGSSGAAAGPTGAQPTSPHSNSTSSRPQAPLSHKTSSPQSISQRSTGLVNTPSRVSSQSRNIAGHQTPPQRSQQKVGGPVHVPQLQQQHQRSPTTPPTPQSHQPTITSLGKQPSHLQTPNKLVQARIAQPHKTSPQSHIKTTNSGGPQPRQAELTSKQGSPKSTQPAANPPNFGEYDDQEWDVGVGHLIIDLDADIAQADRGRMSGAPSTTMVLQQGPPGTPANEDKHSLKMKIKRTKPPTKTSEAKHEIVKPDLVQITPQGSVGTNGTSTTTPSQHNGGNIKMENNGSPRTPTSVPRVVFKKEKRRLDVNGAPVSPPPQQNTPQQNTPQRMGVPHPNLPSTIAPTAITPLPVSQPATTHFGSVTPLVSHQAFSTTSSSVTHTSSISSVSTQILSNSTSLSSLPNNGNMLGHPLQVKMEPRSTAPIGVATSTVSNPVAMQQQPQLLPQQQPKPCLTPLLVSQQSVESQNDRLSPSSKRQKVNEDCDRKDACVGTSVGTITEPDCLGPCEPGSSVTLEGIVWHETEGGVLVVNVTWRGKTYVGTLLDCTKHDWAPPRYCDSPTSDLESRTPKGRAKRGRTAASSSNTASTTNTPITELSVTETRSGKLRNATMKGRRGGGTPTFNPPPSPVKSETGGTKRKGRETESSTQPDPKSFKRSRSCSRSTPTNGCSSPSLEQQLASQGHTQNGPQETYFPPSSPQLIECPEPNCNKKYKHINGLKYHQSHAHTSSLLSNDDEASTAEKSENSEVEENRNPSPTPVISLPADASAQDLIKPAALRPTPIPLPPQVTKDEVNVPSSQIQVNGAAQLPNSPQQVFTYSNNSGNTSPQKPSAVLPSVIASNKPLKGIQQSNEQSVQNLLASPSLIIDVNNLSQQQASKDLQPVPQGVNQPSQTNSASKSSQVQQNSQGIPQPQQLSAHVPQPATTQPLPISQSQAIQVNHNTHLIQCSPQNQLPSQMHPSQHLQSQIHPSTQVSIQNLTTSTPQSTIISQTSAVSASSHVSSPVYTNSQIPPSSSASMQPQQHLTSPYLSTQNQLQLLSAYNQQMIDSCPPIAPPQHNSPQTGRHDVLGGLVPGHGSSNILRNNSDSNSPVQNVQLVLPHNVSNIPQGTPLSSLPGATPLLAKDKSFVEGEKMLAKQKQLVNGISPMKEEEANREDARSPAYSDISDANDSTSVIDGESDSKDFKDEKKPELPLGATSQYAYGLYHHFGPYGQPHHPYMMPSIQPPPGLPMKPCDIKDLKDKQEKDKKDGGPHLPTGNEYMKFPPHYLYSYSHLYPPGYPDPYLREPMYKDMLEKSKFEQKEILSADEMDKGPTDLSRNCSNSDKNPLNLRDVQLSVNPGGKEPLDTRLHATPEKRSIDPVQSYRYLNNSYDSRLQVGGGPPLEKLNDSKVSISSSKSGTPIPLSSPRLGSTPPVSNNKEEKCEKRNEGKSEGVKPTMETTGPPPPPTSSAYYPPFPYSHVAFDPYRPQLVPSLPAGFPPSYLHGPNLGLRYPMGITNAPEDLSRSGSGGPMLSSSGLYAGSHKIAELQERAQKLQSVQPVSSSSGVLARGGSPLNMYSKDLHCGNMVQLPPHSMSPISSSPSSTSYTSSIVSQHGSLMASSMGLSGDRKTPPVGSRLAHPMPESYPYPLLSAQFPPHFPALGVTPPNMPSVGGPGVPPSGLGGGALLPK